MRNYALGFRDCGAQVQVLAMAPMQAARDNPRGVPLAYEGITYTRTSALDLRPLARGVGRLRWLIGLYGSIWPTRQRLKQLIQNRQCDLFVSYGRNAALLWPLLKLCRAHGVPTVLDVTELAEYFNGLGGKFSPIYWDWQLGANHMPRDFNLITTITYALADKYRALGCRQVMVVPSIEAWDNLPPVETLSGHDEFRLVYVGALIDRDAPDVLLDALRLLRARSVAVTLDVLGRYQRSREGSMRAARLQADPMLRSSVNLIGEVNDEELTQRLRSADGLVLLRRDAPTEVAAFPTRLVEYLKQGRPVFVSDVGDVRRYLRPEIDAVLLAPGDPTQTADAIQRVAQSADRGYALGVQGRVRGAECFDRVVHAARVLDAVSRASSTGWIKH